MAVKYFFWIPSVPPGSSEETAKFNNNKLEDPVIRTSNGFLGTTLYCLSLYFLPSVFQMTTLQVTNIPAFSRVPTLWALPFGVSKGHLNHIHTRMSLLQSKTIEGNNTVILITWSFWFQLQSVMQILWRSYKYHRNQNLQVSGHFSCIKKQR